MKLADLCATTWPITVPFPGGKSVELEVRWEKLTDDFFGRLSDLTVTEALCELVAGWDLVETVNGAEVPVPITPERVQEIPLPIRSLLLQGALRAARPNLTTPEA